MKEVINDVVNAPAAIGPYSQAVKAGGFLFISGQIPVDPATGQSAGDIQGQTAQVLQNIDAILTREGLTSEAVVKTGVFLQDLKDFQTMNALYAEYFTQAPPARACVQIARLPKDVLVEIEAIAVY